MSKRPTRESTPSTPAASPAPPPAILDRWPGRLALVLASALLLSLAFAPFGQFYMAWVGLAPFLVLTCRCRSHKSAFFWGWLTGFAVQAGVMGWLGLVTLPGTAGLFLFLAIYWGLAAVAVRAVGLFRWPNMAKGEDHAGWLGDGLGALAAMAGIAAIWASTEWLRGHVLWGGLPWVYLGHTQTPLLAICQIADVTGVYGISFWLVLVNALVAFAILRPDGIRRLILPAGAIALVAVALVLYGAWRMAQPVTTAGPALLLVQANYPQSTTGEKGADPDVIVDFHVAETEQALSQSKPVDLVVWSETMMPELNTDYGRAAIGHKRGKFQDYGKFLADTRARISTLTAGRRVYLLTGSAYTGLEGEWYTDRRNSAFLYDRTGRQLSDRYDKIHLVPFGEFVPFKQSIPIFYKVLRWLTPEGQDNLTSGDPSAITAFTIQSAPDQPRETWRFVTPICFEDLDANLVGRMVCPEPGSTRKRADFLVNVTNDGWFSGGENALHFQAAIFRSIENRVPTARCVNTGISGFIDSCGRTNKTLAARTTGTLRGAILLDERIAPYTRIGDVFAYLCLIATCGLGLLATTRPMRRGT